VTPLGVGFGVGAALSWGVSDFGGGLASRRVAPLAAVVSSQAVSVSVAIAVLALVGERYPGSESVTWAIVAGVAAFISLVSFYRSLASGAMGLAAAVSGVMGAGLPVVAGAISGEHLQPADVAGIAFALVAVVLVAWPANDVGIGRESLALAVLAGVAGGCFFIAMGRSTLAGGETGWPVAASRMTVFVLAVAATVLLRKSRATVRGASPLIVLVGLTDMIGSAFFVSAGTQGALSVAAVVSSQYPALTAVLARVILNERLARPHVAGIALALIAIALIALP
jgi:drug/metabolite transporter (DMT)-like permease